MPASTYFRGWPQFGEIEKWRSKPRGLCRQGKPEPIMVSLKQTPTIYRVTVAAKRQRVVITGDKALAIEAHHYIVFAKATIK